MLSFGCISLRPRPKLEIIWVCESPAIIVYSDVAIFPRFGGKRDVAHLIYVKTRRLVGVHSVYMALVRGPQNGQCNAEMLPAGKLCVMQIV